MITPSEVRYRDHFPMWATFSVTLMVMLCALCIFAPPSPYQILPLNRASTKGQDFPLEISPGQLSLGVVKSGQKARGEFTLVNRGSKPVVIDRIETSCPCLITSPRLMRVDPGTARSLTVEFDASSEPDFHGGLSIEIVGYTDGRVRFSSQAKLEVRPDTHVEVEDHLFSSPKEAKL